MERDQDRSSDAGQFEWVNAWAQTARVDTAPAAETIPVALDATPAEAAKIIVPALPDDQLMKDIAEIERARDALAEIPIATAPTGWRAQALTLAARRTSDSVPLVVGAVLALSMLTVFGAAAAMTKLVR